MLKLDFSELSKEFNISWDGCVLSLWGKEILVSDLSKIKITNNAEVISQTTYVNTSYTDELEKP